MRKSQSQSRIHECARHMRHHLTPSEDVLWRAIRGGRLGAQFRRQVVVGRFIADFAAPKERLIVEVDGGYHSRREATDARRDAALQRAGWRVVRLPAELVERELPLALARIREALLAPE